MDFENPKQSPGKKDSENPMDNPTKGRFNKMPNEDKGMSEEEKKALEEKYKVANEKLKEEEESDVYEINEEDVDPSILEEEQAKTESEEREEQNKEEGTKEESGEQGSESNAEKVKNILDTYRTQFPEDFPKYEDEIIQELEKISPNQSKEALIQELNEIVKNKINPSE